MIEDAEALLLVQRFVDTDFNPGNRFWSEDTDLSMLSLISCRERRLRYGSSRWSCRAVLRYPRHR